ncbi:O-antigen ligase family protein [Algoriphagus hitonicola]|nr:O-antigen ligase family protein [Algoriphagus hitonicola]
MAHADPFIPYELGKYIMFLLCVVGIVLNFNQISRGKIGLLLLILLLPSFFIDQSGMVSFGDLRFNILGMINLALGIIFLSTIRVSLIRFVRWFKLLVYPCISVLAFTIIKNPDLRETEFDLGANFLTAGGFGSNQVATVLGIGAFIFSVSLILDFRITKNRALDILFLALFVIQGLLTFSRGGMIGAFLAVFVFLFYIQKLKAKDRVNLKIPNIKRFVLPVILFLTVFFFVANYITSGMLLLRYKGETKGTLSGQEKTLNKLTTNRSDMFLEDLDVWMEYPILGAGASASVYLRDQFKGIAPHVELSRLLADHGMIGLLIFLIILIFAIVRVNRAREKISKSIIASFLVLSLFTSFHSATRTFTTPLFFALGSVSIVSSQKKPKSRVVNRPLRKNELQKVSL